MRTWVFACLLTASLSVGGAAVGQENAIAIPGGDERLIVYGGFSALRDEAAFAKFIDSYGLDDYAQDLIRGYPIGNTKVSVNGEEVLAELSRRDGVAASVSDIQAAVGVGLLYTVTFVSSFQEKVVTEEEYEGTVYRTANYLVSIAPVISRGEDGTIVFSASASKLKIVENYSAAVQSAEQDEEEFARLYREALPKALKTLQTVIEKSLENDTNRDRYMVVAVVGKEPTLKRVFAIKDKLPVQNRVFCEGDFGDPSSGELWRSLKGHIADAATSIMAAQGRNVVPPALWAAWTGGARRQTEKSGYVIGFSRSGGLRELKSKMQLRLSPAEADRKVIVQLGEFVSRDKKRTGIEKTFIREYRVPMQAVWYETASARECDRIVDSGVVFEISKPKPAYQILDTDTWGQPAKPNDQATFGWVAIVNELKDFGR